MITIFTTPRPFHSLFDIIQRNAIQSWLKACPNCEVILFDDEEGTTLKIAEEMGLKCITDVECNEFDTPLLNDVFNKVKKIARHKIIAQVNADIILMSDFIKAVEEVQKVIGGNSFFMSGRRWNLEIQAEINFNENDWERKLRDRIAKEGKLYHLSGMDYWVFPRHFQFNPPPFIVGRPGMDSWLIYKARSLKIPVIDATEVVTIIHQNHNYPQKKEPFFEIEKKRNLKLAGGFSHMCTLRDADWILTPNGLERPGFLRRILSGLSLFYPWRKVLSIKRKLQKFL